MASRVLMGRQSWGEYGFWVSKPGVNVLGGSDDAMLLSSSRKQAQVIASGILYGPGIGQHPIYHPDMGFLPHVLVSSPRYLTTVVHVSGAQTNISVNQILTFGSWATNNEPAPPYEVRWAVLNISG